MTTAFASAKPGDRCEWHDDVARQRCTRTDTGLLLLTRPCGHDMAPSATCPGHMEALAGESTAPTRCDGCGRANALTATPDLASLRARR